MPNGLDFQNRVKWFFPLFIYTIMWHISTHVKYLCYNFFMSRLKNHKLIPVNLPHNEPIGKRLAIFRKEQGLTQKELADKIGVTRSVIMDYERNKNHLYDDIIIRIVIVLGISADELLGLKQTQKKEYPSKLRIIKRLKKIEKLPINKQKKVLENLDIFLKGVEK